MRALEIAGKDVVIPTNTFFATAAAVLVAGGRVRLADIDSDTLSLSVKSLSQAITQQIRLFSARHPNVHCTIGRLFNVIGGFETSPRLAPEVVRRALLGVVIPIGNLTPRRDYVHVKDVARAVVAMTFDDDAPLDVCNIGSGVDWSIEELIGVVDRILGRDLRMQPQPELIRENERRLISARIDKIMERYNWRPRHGLEEAMRDAKAFAQEAA
jgi:UDP-glucose 4-epimerase